MTLTRSFIRNAVTTPLDARLMNMAAVVADANGTPRTGVLGPIGTNLVTASATMSVNIAAAEFATSRGKGDGVSIFTNDGVVNVPISAAPISNSRIDVVWVKHNDDTQGDANSNPVFGVTDGVAAGSPVPAAIPTGALELAQVRVYAGTTATSGGSNTITQTYRMTASRGGVVPFRTKAELDAWTTAPQGQYAVVLADGMEYRRLVTFWVDAIGAGSTTPTIGTGWQTPSILTISRANGLATFAFNAQAASNRAIGSIVATIPAGYRFNSHNIWGHGWGLLGAVAALQCYLDAGTNQVKINQPVNAGQSLALTLQWPVTA